MLTKLLLPCLLLVPTFATASIVSTFDSNVEGWTLLDDPSPLEYQPTGGNSGGYVQANDTTGVNLFTFLVAPSVFHGDLSSYVDGTISFDARLDFSNGGPLEHVAGWVYLTSGGTTIANRLGDDILGM